MYAKTNRLVMRRVPSGSGRRGPIGQFSGLGTDMANAPVYCANRFGGGTPKALACAAHYKSGATSNFTPVAEPSFWDTITGAAGTALDVWGKSKQANADAARANADLAAAMAARQNGGGIDTTTLAIGGLALAGVLFIALRKK